MVFIFSRQQYDVEVRKTDIADGMKISHSTSTLQSDENVENQQKSSINKQQVYFEGLPNFIVYGGEDTKVWFLMLMYIILCNFFLLILFICSEN